MWSHFRTESFSTAKKQKWRHQTYFVSFKFNPCFNPVSSKYDAHLHKINMSSCAVNAQLCRECTSIQNLPQFIQVKTAANLKYTCLSRDHVLKIYKMPCWERGWIKNYIERTEDEQEIWGLLLFPSRDFKKSLHWRFLHWMQWTCLQHGGIQLRLWKLSWYVE